MTQATARNERSQAPSDRRRVRSARKRNKNKAWFYLFPTFLILGVFVYFPIFESFRLSLSRVAPFGGLER